MEAEPPANVNQLSQRPIRSAFSGVTMTYELPTLEPGAAVPRRTAWRGLLGCGCAAVLGGLSMQAHLLSGSDLGGALGVSADDASWVPTIGAAAEGGSVLIAAPLVGVFGARRVLAYASIATGLFAGVGRLVVSSFPLVALARMLESLACGVLPVVMMVWCMRAFSVERRGLPLALFAFASSLPSALASGVAGLATLHLRGSGVFVFDMTWAPLVAVIVLLSMPHERTQWRAIASLDKVGLAILSCAIVMLLVFLNQGERRFWLETSWMKPLLAAALFAFALAFAWLLNAKAPLLDLGLLRRPTFAIGMAEALSLRFGLLMAGFAIPQALARLQGLRPEQSENALIWLAAGQIGGFSLAYVWLQRGDARWPLMTGLSIFAAAAALSARIDPSWSAQQFETPLILAGLGQGFFLTSVMRYATWNIPPQAGATAAGLFNLTRVLGASAASGAVGYFLRLRENGHSARLVEGVVDANVAALARLDDLKASYAVLTADAGEAQSAATAALAQSVAGQSFTLAFSDVFLAIAAILIAFACIAALLPRIPAYLEEPKA
jgi:DHA2 family multidrug resistance protein